MKKREETAATFAYQGDTFPSGMRRLSMASVALLDLTGNKYLPMLLEGAENPHDRIELLKYIFIHSAPLDDVILACQAFRKDPRTFELLVLKWAHGVTPTQALAAVQYINEEADDVANVSARIIPSAGGDVSKNGQRQQG